MTPEELRDDPGTAALLKQLRTATVKAREAMMATELRRAMADGRLGLR